MCSLACVCPMAHVCPYESFPHWKTCKYEKVPKIENQNKNPKPFMTRRWPIKHRPGKSFTEGSRRSGFSSLRGWQEVHVGLRDPSERTWPSSGHRGIRSSGLDSCHPSAGNICSWDCEGRTHRQPEGQNYLCPVAHTFTSTHTAQHTLYIDPVDPKFSLISSAP